VDGILGTTVKGLFRRFVPWFVVLVVIVGGVVLGVLQVRWVGEASRAEEARLRASLFRGVEQVRSHAEDEVRVVLSLARAATAALASGDLSSVADSLSLWQENTRFPGLLRGLHLVSWETSEAVLAWSADQERFIESSFPVEIAVAIPSTLGQAQDLGSWPTAELPDGRRLVLLPAYDLSVDRPIPAPAAVAVDLDAGVFYGDVVPYYMNRNLAEFPCRIVDLGDGSTIGNSDNLPEDGQPEAVVGLRSLGLTSLEPRNEHRPQPVGGTSGPLDPLLQAWLQRAQGEAEIAIRRFDLPLAEAAEAKLEVFYPGGTLAGTMRARQVLSLAVSLGLVGMLVAGVGVLSRLYRRSVRLRASEQEFVASVSHELRTPIAVIQATSENLRAGAVSDPARLPRYAEVIHGQVKRLAGMVESILLYAGLESGMVRRPSPAEVVLPRLVEEVTQPLQQLAADRGCHLAVSASPLPPVVCTDGTALRLVIENLLTNAILHAGAPEVRLSVNRPGPDTLRIAVEDDGQGIPSREQARVFEPFVRGERSVREQRPGSGLGLHLVRRVVGLLGGRVVLESPWRDDGGVERAGCRFTVTLPCRERCDEA
jgi:signal transduction histidine kinase